MDGVIVVDKPSGWTSHDVVNRVRRIAGTRRVGHLGTLDPPATGVLPLVVGKATRLAQFYARSEKVYEGTIRFGYATGTYDSEGTPLGEDVAPEIGRGELEKVLGRFRGTILQTPPPVSAKKIGGTPAYVFARKQKPVELVPVEVTVHSLELLDLSGRDARVRVRCSAGTYLRSIAHEAGQALGCGAFLMELRRIASGEFSIERARTLDALGELAADDRLGEALIPGAQLLPDFPNELVDQITAGQIRNGRDFRVSPFQAKRASRYVKAVTPQGELVAIGEARLPHIYHPVLVL